MDVFSAAWYTRNMPLISGTRNPFLTHSARFGALALCASLCVGCLLDAPGAASPAAGEPAAMDNTEGPNALRDEAFRLEALARELPRMSDEATRALWDSLTASLMK